MICSHCQAVNPNGVKYCLKCGAALAAGQPESPQMGMPVNGQPYQQPPAYRTSGLAIASLVLGIFAPCTLGLSGLVGIVLAIVALVQINQPQNGLKGSGLAIAGIIVPVGLLLLTIGIGFPLFRPFVSAGICAANAQRLGQEALAYAQDHDGALPTPEQFWAIPGLPEDAFNCPQNTDGDIGYGYYQDAGTKLLHEIDPATTPLLADGGNADGAIVTDDDIARRHMEGYVVFYASGEAEPVDLTFMGTKIPSE